MVSRSITREYQVKSVVLSDRIVRPESKVPDNWPNANVLAPKPASSHTKHSGSSLNWEGLNLRDDLEHQLAGARFSASRRLTNVTNYTAREHGF
jgi:hypothetical protein